MKHLLTFIIVVAGCVSSLSTLQAGLTITGANYGAFANFTGDSASDNFSDNANSTINGSVSKQDGAMLGTNGDLGDYSYQYTAGNTASVAANTASLNVFASTDFSAQSNTATFATSNEGVSSYLDFTIDQSYNATINFTSLLSPTNSPNFSVLSSFAFLVKDGNVVHSFSNGIDNQGTVTTFGTIPFPGQILLTAGSYRLYTSVSGQRNTSYDLPDLNMSSTASLNLTAVPEPTSLVLWGCVAAYGLPKLRRRLKERNELVA